jgi:hypothetical protein
VIIFVRLRCLGVVWGVRERGGDLISFGVWGGGGGRGISDMVVMWFGEGIDGVVGEGEGGWRIGRSIVAG